MKKSIISVVVLAALATSFNGCGNSSSSSNGTSSNKIDLAQYFEEDSRVYNMVHISQSSEYPEPTITHYTDTIEVKDDIITHEIFGQRSFVIDINENDLNVTDIQKNVNYSVKRHVSIGEEVSSYSIDTPVVTGGLNAHVKETATCVLDEKRDSITLETEDENATYEGDIIVQVCTVVGTETYLDLNESFDYTNIYYEYYDKGKGRIGAINEDCLVPHQNTNPDNNATYYEINDNSDECIIEKATFDLLLD